MIYVVLGKDIKIVKKRIEELISKLNIDNVIKFAFMKYTENFAYIIQQLLHNFPEDYTNNDGSKFWSGSKRVPHPIPYNVDEELAFLFVKNYTIILAIEHYQLLVIYPINILKKFPLKLKFLHLFQKL